MKKEGNFKNEKKKVKKKHYALICPYCGARAKLVTQADVYGRKAFHPNEKVWVCANWGRGCDALVTAYPGMEKPKGDLANKELRSKRMAAHRAIDEVVRLGIMDFHSVYKYLEDSFGFRKGKFHIASSSLYYCEETIRMMNDMVRRHQDTLGQKKGA